MPGLGTVLSVLLIPMGWGVSVAFLDNHRRTTNDPFHVGCLIDGYRDFVRIFLTLLLSSVYTLLWALLLIVPGIIKGLSYALTPYILRDHPELKYNAAIEKSMAMMEGHKADLFWLHLSFIGWILLCVLTLFIGLFWLQPYVNSTLANFYEEVKQEYEQGGVTEATIIEEETGYNKSER